MRCNHCVKNIWLRITPYWNYSIQRTEDGKMKSGEYKKYSDSQKWKVQGRCDCVDIDESAPWGYDIPHEEFVKWAKGLPYES